jgi:hypothetical protein
MIVRRPRSRRAKIREQPMPLVRIDLRKGKQAAYREAISRIVHQALVSVGAPKDDRFQVISEHDSENFVFDPNYLDIRRRRRRFTRRSPTGSQPHSASIERTSLLASSRSKRRTGRSVMGSLNTPELFANAIAPA